MPFSAHREFGVPPFAVVPAGGVVAAGALFVPEPVPLYAPVGGVAVAPALACPGVTVPLGGTVFGVFGVEPVPG